MRLAASWRLIFVGVRKVTLYLIWFFQLTTSHWPLQSRDQSLCVRASSKSSFVSFEVGFFARNLQPQFRYSADCPIHSTRSRSRPESVPSAVTRRPIKSGSMSSRSSTQRSPASVSKLWPRGPKSSRPVIRFRLPWLSPNAELTLSPRIQERSARRPVSRH